MTTKHWIVLFLVIALICTGAILWQVSGTSHSTVLIKQDGVCLHTIDLSQVTTPYSITVEWGGCKNTIQITQDTVWVSEADCSNQVCVDHGPLTPDGAPIVCLPHRLIISWSESQVDA